MWPILLLLLLSPGPAASNQETASQVLRGKLAPPRPAEPPMGGCSQPQPLCCPGADHHCRRGSCFCDDFCRVVSDCCPDHSALCTPASHTVKMVLRVVLRLETPPGTTRNELEWVQDTVQRLLQRPLPGRPLSVTVRGIRSRP